ncbi:MAG: Plug domain-containing protein [Paraprevotella sp.]|nr:Plug domain-containing protein [Paraprevotella sp.]
MGNRTLRSILCLIGGYCLSHTVKAQNAPDSIRNLGEVEVKAQTYKEVIPAQKLKGEELKKLNSFSVADAIRYFSGLQIKDYGGVAGLKTVNIRSMGTNHMGVYFNGIQLGNAQNGQVDLG